MISNRPPRFAFAALLILPSLIAGSSFLFAQQTDQVSSPAQSSAQQENPIVIETDSALPDGYPRRPYQVRLAAHGGMTSLLWSVERGTFPPGLKLDSTGFIHGEPDRGGVFRFTVTVSDRGAPRQSVQKEFTVHVRSAFNLDWKSPARVNGNRIEGSVVVSNTTPDDIDLTFVVLAVAGNGRATAIGYQHFSLPAGAVENELPFGETLPPGAYVIHVDVVGEVESKNLIYRERMQTPRPLQVTVGP